MVFADSCLIYLRAGSLTRLYRKRNPKHRPYSHMAADCDLAAMLLDNSVRGGKSKTRALPHWPRGEERIKNLRQHRFWDAFARIFYFHPDLIPFHTAAQYDAAGFSVQGLLGIV